MWDNPGGGVGTGSYSWRPLLQGCQSWLTVYRGVGARLAWHVFESGQQEPTWPHTPILGREDPGLTSSIPSMT